VGAAYWYVGVESMTSIRMKKEKQKGRMKRIKV
jgi:hypothetical protein